MELTQLQYFRVLARNGNMTRAAEELHITQPALSRSIAALEEDIGAPLFIRDHGKLTLSRAGELFLETADKINIEIQNGLTRVNSMETSGCTNIHYGVTYHGLISLGLSYFLEQNPEVHVFEEIVQIGAMKNFVETGMIDFAYTTEPIMSPVVDTYRLISDKFVAVVARGSRFDLQPQIRFEDLHSLPLIIAGNHRQLDAIYASPNFSSNVFYEGEDILFALSLVLKQLGCLVISQSYYRWLISNRNLNTSNLRMLPIFKGHREVPFDIFFSKLRGRQLSAASEQFSNFISDFYKS